MNSYQEGNIVRFLVTFREEQTRQAVDPTAVSFSYQLAGSASSAPITYTSATTPAIGVLARTGVGRYETWVSVAGLAGTLTGKYVSTGTGQTTAIDTVTIIPNPF